MPTQNVIRNTKYVKRNIVSRLTCHVSPAFTLIELLIVISILSLLFGLSLASYSLSQAKARDSRRKSDIKAISSALALYNHDQDAYPTNLTASLNNYLNPLPTDPKTSTSYTYSPTGCVGLACTGYSLIACLENGNDPQKDASKYTGCSAASYSATNPQ